MLKFNIIDKVIFVARDDRNISIEMAAVWCTIEDEYHLFEHSNFELPTFFFFLSLLHISLAAREILHSLEIFSVAPIIFQQISY